MTILIVDDSKPFQLLLDRKLRKAGYKKLAFASSAEEAFEILGVDNSKPTEAGIDLILMDNNMPGMNGLEATKKIKSVTELTDIPIIIITASSKLETLKKSFDAGAMDYISKPPNTIELTVRVKSALRLKREINMRKAQALELKRLSATDGLTDIANRRQFDEYFKRVFGTGERNSSYLSLLLMDIDFFKPYNDTYGHLEGDKCLIKVTRVAKKEIKRPGDMIARYGGEEFAVLLPETDEKGERLVAENLCSRIEAANIPHKGSKIGKHVTVSIGVTTSIPGDEMKKPEEFIEAADGALYEAKEDGRNRVVCRSL